ncbi:unknown protein [Seminavis robusta]|uniref:BTB domain-containing protein n=1 Tax=Seminavis robusta TaxID=568900 RepID=A0A9N8ETB9_9STRA|nr:unknown protein [Seminavis robusta]|eukprot:Sro1526_g279770.1 n/a (319) ;mRNA; r:11438-12394
MAAVVEHLYTADSSEEEEEEEEFPIEPSNEAVLESLLYDRESHNLVLVGCDGGKVTAHRHVLAARCPGFSRSLESNPDGFTTQKIEEYPASVLQVVVDYVYTGKLKEQEPTEDNGPLKWGNQRIQLLNSSHFFGLKRMRDEVMVQLTPKTALLMPEVASSGSRTNGTASKIKELSYLQLQNLPDETMAEAMPKGVLNALSTPVLTEIMENECLEATRRFEILSVWQGARRDAGDPDLKETCRDLAKSIPLHKIPPTILATKVKNSGFIPRDWVFKALEKQALNAETACGFPFFSSPKKKKRIKLDTGTCERSMPGLDA